MSGVSFAADAGEFTGLIGPNGCGKTTLLRTISGILPAYSGEVLVNGKDIKKTGKAQLAKIMACLSQDIAVDFSFTVGQVVMMGRYPHLSRIARESAEDIAIVRNSMALADVLDLADRPITEISAGQRQRAFVAMCLAQQPRILLLDEATSHLDIAHQLSILDLVKDLNRRSSLTVVAVFHDLNLAAEYCDRIIVLKEGCIQAFGRPVEVLTADMIRSVYDAEVLTQKNPISSKPHIVITAQANRQGEKD